MVRIDLSIIQCPLSTDHASSPNTPSGDPAGLTGQKLATTSYWYFACIQKWYPDCPLDDDQSERPPNSNDKPGGPGLARGKPGSTNSDLRLGDFASTVTIRGLPNSTTYNLRGLNKTANNKESSMESNCSFLH